jgi:hypothetical protein
MVERTIRFACAVGAMLAVACGGPRKGGDDDDTDATRIAATARRT